MRAAPREPAACALRGRRCARSRSRADDESSMTVRSRCTGPKVRYTRCASFFALKVKSAQPCAISEIDRTRAYLFRGCAATRTTATTSRRMRIARLRLAVHTCRYAPLDSTVVVVTSSAPPRASTQHSTNHGTNRGRHQHHGQRCTHRSTCCVAGKAESEAVHPPLPRSPAYHVHTRITKISPQPRRTGSRNRPHHTD